MISYEFDNGLAVLRMDDGKRNVVGPAFVAAMNTCLDRAEADAAQAVVLEGREGTFSAGFDLKEFQKGPEPAAALVQGGFEILLRLFDFQRPVVAACSGHGIGMGAFLLMVSDLRIGAEGDYKFSLPESRLNMDLGLFLAAIAQARITPRYLTRVAILSEDLDPQAARKAGILDDLRPQAEVSATAHAMARQLAAMPAAFGPNKSTVRAAALREMRAALAASDG